VQELIDILSPLPDALREAAARNRELETQLAALQKQAAAEDAVSTLVSSGIAASPAEAMARLESMHGKSPAEVVGSLLAKHAAFGTPMPDPRGTDNAPQRMRSLDDFAAELARVTAG
jgi:phage shock protein A